MSEEIKSELMLPKGEELLLSPSPHIHDQGTIQSIMLKVVLALLPVIAVGIYFFGLDALRVMFWCVFFCITLEMAWCYFVGKPVIGTVKDGSALVTGLLLGLNLSAATSWWVCLIGGVLAIWLGKQVFGGLGQNPFNPAMVAFAACIVSFPALMSQWPALGLKLTFAEQVSIIAGLAPRIDVMSGATPLDAIKTALKLGEGTVDVPTLLATQDVFGNFAGRGWEWVTTGYLLGGLWLWQRRIITWYAPLGFICGLSLLAGALWLWNPQGFASPLFHLFSGGAMLGAFFIVTDPVSGCTTSRGKLIFGFLAGLLAYTIRVFGGYPDGVAFAVLLMNLCVPLIDMYTQPPIFGMKNQR